MAMDTSMAIFDAEITVLDYESTGSVQGFSNEPWQIGMVSLKGGKIDPNSLYESFLNVSPNRPFNYYAPGRHTLLRNELSIAPTPQELWPHIMSRLTDIPLCAHNVATEKKFSRAMAPMHRFGPWIDTLKISRKVWPGCTSYALEDLVDLFGLGSRINKLCPNREAHDALYDAVASAMLLEYLLEQPGWGSITVGELASM
ncbi:MAG TPA: 3'-5' exonuclease [Pontiella sp.]